MLGGKVVAAQREYSNSGEAHARTQYIYPSLPPNTMQYNAMHTMQYHSIQCNTTREPSTSIPAPLIYPQLTHNLSPAIIGPRININIQRGQLTRESEPCCKMLISPTSAPENKFFPWTVVTTQNFWPIYVHV